MEIMNMEHTVTFEYKNYKGEISKRYVLPMELWYGTTPYHTEAQWLLKAFDINKNDYRNFSLKEIRNWSESNDKNND